MKYFLPCCHCPFSDTMIHLHQCSYYKGMGLIRDRGCLYVAPLSWTGLHFVQAMMHVIDSKRIKHVRDKGVAMAFITVKYVPTLFDVSTQFDQELVFFVKGERDGRSIMQCLLRIQRAIRAFLKARMAERRIAMAMGLHSRLGSASVLSCLCPDMLHTVLSPGTRCT